jgi:uncharacterized protein YjcR
MLDEKKAWKLWWDAWEDIDIAEQLKVPWQRVKAWRKKNDLPSNEGLLTWDKKGQAGRPRKGLYKRRMKNGTT